MKISGFGVGAPEKTKTSKTKAKAKSSKTSKSSYTDEVDVSDHVQTLDLIRDMVAASPDIRLEEVDRIVRKLRGGKYKIDFEKVAEGFIKEAIMTEIVRKPRRK